VPAGARLFGTGRDRRSLAALEQAGAVATLPGDLGRAGFVDELVSAAVGALGGLDVVVSCAGAGWAGPYATMSAQEVDAVVDLNLRAPMQLARVSAPHLAHGGQMVLVGSVAGLVGVPYEAAYAATKAGLKGLADSLRAEWPGTTVTLVSPAAVQTPFFSRRNRPYERSWPPPMSVAKPVDAIVGAIEHRRPEVVVPAWMSLVGRFSAAAPGLYRAVSGLPERLTR
jgi:short-subunit dehydrogenase